RLRDETLSVSAVWGRAFVADGRVLGHVIDPRLGEPVMTASMAAVRLPSATESDALSTALLVLGEAGRKRLATLRPGIGMWLRTAGWHGNPRRGGGGTPKDARVGGALKGGRRPTGP
ncbi:MAG: FAD:protein FMN transferase, partial [Verrucomicrobiota bacterium]